MKKVITFLGILCFLIGCISFAAEDNKDKPLYSVKLISFDNKINTIQEIRRRYDMDLKEAKELVENAPVIVADDLSEEDAEDLKTGLENQGCKVEVIKSIDEPGQLAKPEKNPQKEEKEDRFSIILLSYSSKVHTIKEIRKHTGLGLSEASDLLKKVPVIIADGLNGTKARTMRDGLKGEGCEVEVVESAEAENKIAELAASPTSEKTSDEKVKRKAVAKKKATKAVKKKKKTGVKIAAQKGGSSVIVGDAQKEPPQKIWYSVVYLGSDLPEKSARETLKEVYPECAGEAHILAYDPPGTIKMSLERADADELADKFKEKGLRVIVVPNMHRPHIKKSKEEYKEARKIAKEKKVRRIRNNLKGDARLGEDDPVRLIDIKVFEGDKGYAGPLVSPPALSQRDYNDEFIGGKTRYIYVEPEFQKPYDKETSGKSVRYKVDVILYGPDGELWAEDRDKVSVRSGSVTTKHFRFEAANWPAGEYMVVVKIEGREEGAQRFSIFPGDAGAVKSPPELLKLRFFEGGAKAPQKEEREYRERFPRSKARFIYSEANLRNFLYGKEEGKYNIERIYYKPDGTELYKDKKEGILDPEKSTVTDIWGWGYADPGKWWTGKYKAEIYLDGEKVDTQDFEIYNDLFRGKGGIIDCEKIDLFEAEAKAADPKSYKTVFNSSTARYIYVRPSFRNLMYHDKKITYNVDIVFSDLGGKEISKMTRKFEVDPEWETCYFLKGWGKPEPGFWKPGEYQVKVSGRGIKEKSAKFIVK